MGMIQELNGERREKARMKDFHWPQRLSEMMKMNSKVTIYYSDEDLHCTLNSLGNLRCTYSAMI